jgi:hypothetical protein
MPGLGKKTFTAGDVLIAGDVNNYLMDQTVMNFATVAARSSAIPVPSTGMVSYVGDTGSETPASTIPQIQAYTGAAWQNLDGLTLLAKLDFTSATTVTMDNVFSATHRNYLIHMSTNTTGTGTINSLQLRAGGVTTAGSGYFSSIVYGDLTTVSILNAVNGGANWTLRNVAPSSYSLTLFNPFQTTPTMATGTLVAPSATLNSHGTFGGHHNGNTSFDGIQINCTTATGILRIYGMRDA